MTLCAGIIAGKDVIMAGDRGAVSMDELSTDVIEQPKVFRKGDFLIGGSESFRMLQLLQHVFEPPSGHTGPLMKYMVGDFVPALRAVMSSGGFPESGDEAGPPGKILVGIHGHLFVIQGDYAVLESKRPYDAIGCGTPYFFGAMQALRIAQPRLAAHHQLATAMEVAESNTFAVKGPFDILYPE